MKDQGCALQYIIFRFQRLIGLVLDERQAC